MFFLFIKAPVQYHQPIMDLNTFTTAWLKYTKENCFELHGGTNTNSSRSPVSPGQRQSKNRAMKELEHLTQGKADRAGTGQLGDSHIVEAVQIPWKGENKKNETDSPQQCPVVRHQNTLHRQAVVSTWGRYSKPTWTQPWAICSKCFEQGVRCRSAHQPQSLQPRDHN